MTYKWCVRYWVQHTVESGGYATTGLIKTKEGAEKLAEFFRCSYEDVTVEYDDDGGNDE